jgi:L-malate glycosyltransferase
MIQEGKIKSLWLASWFPNRKAPLLGNFVAKQAQALSNLCDVALIFITEDAISDYEIEISRVDYLKILVYYPQTYNPISKIYRYAIAWKKALICLKQERFEPDIVHLNILNPTGLVALYFKIFKKIPFLVTEHWSDYNFRKPRQIKWHHRLLIRLCNYYSSHFIAISRYYAESMRQCGFKGQFSVIPNIVDINMFCPPVEKQILPIKKLLHISYLHDGQKNISGILRGIHILSKMRRDFQMIFAGPQESHSGYIDLSNKLKINDLVIFEKLKTNEQVAVSMQEADIFVLFSNIEGLPVVLLEALSVGLPVIATETGGICDWVDMDKGRIVKIGDEKKLAESLNYLLSHIEKFSAEKIRQEVVEKCSNESVSNAIKNVYRRILGESVLFLIVLLFHF